MIYSRSALIQRALKVINTATKAHSFSIVVVDEDDERSASKRPDFIKKGAGPYSFKMIFPAGWVQALHEEPDADEDMCMDTYCGDVNS